MLIMAVYSALEAYTDPRTAYKIKDKWLIYAILSASFFLFSTLFGTSHSMCNSDIFKNVHK